MINIPWTSARFVVYRDPYREIRLAHIETPAFAKSVRSLFPNNGDVLCGTGGEPLSKSRPYAGRDATATEYYDALPEGYTICAQCLAHLRREYLPFVEDEG